MLLVRDSFQAHVCLISKCFLKHYTPPQCVSVQYSINFINNKIFKRSSNQLLGACACVRVHEREKDSVCVCVCETVCERDCVYNSPPPFESSHLLYIAGWWGVLERWLELKLTALCVKSKESELSVRKAGRHQTIHDNTFKKNRKKKTQVLLCKTVLTLKSWNC